MSKLYASINADASKTLATRRGHSRIEAHVRGWIDGCKVSIENGKVYVYRTGGSRGRFAEELLASWTLHVEQPDRPEPTDCRGETFLTAVQ